MKGLIILDGPDCAGKTTLAKEIIRQTGGKYVHLTYRFKDRMFAYHLANLHRAVKESNDHLVVIDRLWMSELCYANAYRGGSKWPYMYSMLEQIILKHAGLEILCLPKDLEAHLGLFKRIKEQREEMYSSISNVTLEYHKLADKIKDWPHVVRYDMFDVSPGELPVHVQSLLGRLQALRESQPEWILDPSNYNITGSLDAAKYIFVGEKTNPNKRHGNWYPFVDYQGSSLHLHKMLCELGVQPHEVMFTNYLQSPDELNKLIPMYDLHPFVFSRDAFGKWMNDHGGMAKMRKQANGLTISTLGHLNNARQFFHPAYDLRFLRGRSLKVDLGFHILSKESYNA